MRQLTINCKDGTFRVRGTGHWADFGEDWLCAHDILHHLPGDRGTVEQELMTFGAEMWFDAHKNSDTFPMQPSALSGVFLGSLKGFRVPSRFLAKPAPEMEHQLPDELIYGMYDFATIGLGRLVHFLKRKQEDNRYRATVRQAALLAGLQHPENVTRYSQWIMFGYLQAQRRWPDSAAAQGLFGELHAFFARAGHFRGSLKILLDEATYTFKPANPSAAQFT